MNYCIVDEYVKVSLNYGVHVGSPFCNINALSEHLHEHDCTSCYKGCSLFFHFNVLLLSIISGQLLKVHMVKTSTATFIKPLLNSPSTTFSIALVCYCKRVSRNLNWGRVIYYPVQHSPAPFLNSYLQVCYLNGSNSL